ncbi:MAG: HAMP domain-containing sensor histidine kinase [Anaerovoracaceae bacterium]
MFNKISIRVRITLISVALLIVCCFGLTLLLNNSAGKIVNTIVAASELTDAKPLDNENNVDTAPTEEGTLIGPPVAATAKESFRMDSLIYMLLMVVCGGALTYYVLGRALKPLKNLNEQVKSVHANNLSESIMVPTTKDEIADLTESFNDMMNKINHAFCLQQEFSASAAHELKTPLAVLQAKIDVFRLQKSHGNAEYEALISVFEKQIYRLRGLVANLLSMTQSEYEEEKSSICIKEIFADIFEELGTVANEKNVKLSMESDESIIKGNLDSIYRALYNLVENAIKYNINGGSVEVKVQKEQSGKVSVIVADTGIGIPEAEKNQVFEPFFRVDKSRSRELGGSGLGLTIVKRIIDNHGGKIEINNNQPNGTVFNIIF